MKALSWLSLIPLPDLNSMKPQAVSYLVRFKRGKEHMLMRYQILNDCLSEVRKSDISTIDRLQLEVALYSLKLVLLAKEETLGSDPSVEEFKSLAGMARRICSPERTKIEIQKFIMQLNEIKERIRIGNGDRPSPADDTARHER